MVDFKELFRKRWVLRADLKSVRDDRLRILGGNLFHKNGPECEKALSPQRVCVRGITSKEV